MWLEAPVSNIHTEPVTVPYKFLSLPVILSLISFGSPKMSFNFAHCSSLKPGNDDPPLSAATVAELDPMVVRAALARWVPL
jgi:hypothetical protein